MGNDIIKNDLDKETVKINKEKAINTLNSFIQYLIDTGDIKDLKKANLISYWLKDYANYIKSETTFMPTKQENYKRGDIIKANLGFNIGNEEGGLHYAIVINNPAKSSGLVTIIPLTSAKSTYKENKLSVNLGTSIMDTIVLKFKTICCASKDMVGKMEKIENPILKQEVKNYLIDELIELQNSVKELDKMKKGNSIALVGNITTISKQRIFTPTIKNKFLKGVSLTDEQLDLIDKKIIELYTKENNIM